MAKRILVIRLRELGDTLLTTPLIRQLSRLNPDAQIDVLCQTSNHVIFDDNPYVTETFVLERKASAGRFLKLAKTLRERRYDLLIDSQGLPKTALLARLVGGEERVGYRNRGWRNQLCYTHPLRQRPLEYAACSHLRLAIDSRVDYSDLSLDFFVDEESEDAARKFSYRYFAGPTVAIFGVDRHGYRNWPEMKTAELADKLSDQGLQPWLVYGPGQESKAKKIALCMRRQAICGYEIPSFSTLRAIFSRCVLCVGSDGGPMHAARAAGIPTVTISTTAHALTWVPANDRCHRVVGVGSSEEFGKRPGVFTAARSLDEIDVDDVMNEVMHGMREAEGAESVREPKRFAA